MSTNSFHASAGARLESSTPRSDNPFTSGEEEHPLRADDRLENLTPSMQEVRLGDDPEPRDAEPEPPAMTPPPARPLPTPEPAPAPAPAPAAPPAPPPASSPPPPPATAMSASAVGASYGDLLAPPPSYADSMMFSRPPEGFARSAAASAADHSFAQSQSQSHAGMMRTVALDPGGGGGGGGGAFSHSDAPRDDREVTSPRGYSDEIVESDPTGDGEILGIDSIPGGGETRGLSVAVTDPQMSLAAGSPFGKKVVTYKVRVVVHDAAAFPEYKTRDAAVWRRFRDFVALANLLWESHKGYFVPPRPEKKPLSASDDAFVRDRAHQLGAYLERLARHPACRKAKELRVFLTAPDLERDPEWLAFAARAAAAPAGPAPAVGFSAPGFSAAPPDSDAMRADASGGAYGAPPGPYGGFANPNAFAAPSPGAARKGNVGKFFNRLGAVAAGALTGTGTGGVSEDDVVFCEERDRVFRLEQELAIASLKAGRALECEEKFSDALGELGLECVKLAKREDGDAVKRGGGAYGESALLGRDIALRARKMGNAAVRVSRLTRGAVGQLSRSLQPLHEYLSMMPAVRVAVADRNDALGEWQRAASELEAKKARLARLETDITNMLKVDLLKREVFEARQTVEVARGEYETIKARHGDEFNRLEKSRCASFKRMWLAFARTQAAHAERAMQVWRAVAEDLGASPEEWRGAEEANGVEGGGSASP